MMKCTKSTKEKRSAAIRNGLIALAGIVAVFGNGCAGADTANRTHWLGSTGIWRTSWPVGANRRPIHNQHQCG